jgi:hypothetical protein
MSVRHATILALGTVAAVTLGCRDSLGPRDVAGTYVLERVGVEPVPAVIFRDGQGTVRVVADTLRLRVDGRGSFVFIHVIEPAIGGAAPEAPTRIEIDFTYDLVGSTIEISYDCPPMALCIAGPHAIARRFASGLVVQETFGDDAALRIYKRAAR